MQPLGNHSEPITKCPKLPSLTSTDRLIITYLGDYKSALLPIQVFALFKSSQYGFHACVIRPYGLRKNYFVFLEQTCPLFIYIVSVPAIIIVRYLYMYITILTVFDIKIKSEFYKKKIRNGNLHGIAVTKVVLKVRKNEYFMTPYFYHKNEFLQEYLFEDKETLIELSQRKLHQDLDLP